MDIRVETMKIKLMPKIAMHFSLKFDEFIFKIVLQFLKWRFFELNNYTFESFYFRVSSKLRSIEVIIKIANDF